MNKETISKSEKQLQDKNERILFSGIVEKYHEGSSGHAERVIVITNIGITYFKSAKATMRKKFLWIDLKQADYNESQKIITLLFKNKENPKKDHRVKFSSGKCAEIGTAIASYLARILPPAQFKKAFISRLNENIQPNNNQISAVERYKMYAQSYNIEPTYLDTIASIASFRQSNVFYPNVTGNIIQQSLPLIALQVDPLCEDVYFKGSTEEDLFKVASKLPNQISPFSHFTFEAPYSKSIIEMMKKFKDAKDFSTLNLSFKETQMNEEQVKEFCENADFHKIQGWCFTNAIQKDALPCFMENFFTDDVKQNINAFSLDNCPGVSVVEVLEKLPPQTQIISFKYDQLEISDAFVAVAEHTDFVGLKAVSFRFNTMTKDIPTDAKPLPESIELIDISDCKFEDGNLVSLIKYLFRPEYEKGITILARNIHVSDAELRAASEAIGRYNNHKLVGLDWSQNKLPVEFCEALKKADKLKELYLNLSFNKDSEAEIQNLANNIQEYKSLYRLYLQGNSNSPAGKDLLPLIKELQNVKRLRTLDISNQNIGDEGIISLSDVVSSTDLTCINFDGANPQQPDTLQRFLNVVQERGKKLLISYPIMDRANQSIDQNTLITTLYLCAQEQREPYNPNDPFTAPFDFYFLVKNINDFPEYCSKQYESWLKTIHETYSIIESDGKPESVKEEKSSHKSSSSSSSDHSSDVYREPEERIRIQQQNRAFYENVESDESVSEEKEPAYDETMAHPEPKMITEDGYVEPKWEDWPIDLEHRYDSSDVTSKQERLHSLPAFAEFYKVQVKDL